MEGVWGEGLEKQFGKGRGAVILLCGSNGATLADHMCHSNYLFSSPSNSTLPKTLLRYCCLRHGADHPTCLWDHPI